VTLLLVLAGGAIGAPLRYLTDLFVQSRHDSVFPWGTLAVNVAGSLILGLLAGAADAAAVSDWVLTLVGTGFCGALTTFSTFGYETLRLVEDGSYSQAALNAAVSILLGLGACAAAWWIAAALV
jgi:CrcB protein